MKEYFKEIREIRSRLEAIQERLMFDENGWWRLVADLEEWDEGYDLTEEKQKIKNAQGLRWQLEEVAGLLNSTERFNPDFDPYDF